VELLQIRGVTEIKAYGVALTFCLSQKSGVWLYNPIMPGNRSRSALRKADIPATRPRQFSSPAALPSWFGESHRTGSATRCVFVVDAPLPEWRREKTLSPTLFHPHKDGFQFLDSVTVETPEKEQGRSLLLRQNSCQNTPSPLHLHAPSRRLRFCAGTTWLSFALPASTRGKRRNAIRLITSINLTLRLEQYRTGSARPQRAC